VGLQLNLNYSQQPRLHGHLPFKICNLGVSERAKSMSAEDVIVRHLVFGGKGKSESPVCSEYWNCFAAREKIRSWESINEIHRDDRRDLGQYCE
jgi:hypothetical protein